MSPLLFTMYIDVLLCRLKRSGYGCYIGNMFCGALGYADDVIIMAPTVTATKQMLNICADYGIEYNVLFNPDKTKCIHINKLKCNIVLNVQFMGKLIETVNYDNNLGFQIGNVNQPDVISHAVNQFTVKVNMVVSHFKHLRYEYVQNVQDLLYAFVWLSIMGLYRKIHEQVLCRLAKVNKALI